MNMYQGEFVEKVLAGTLSEPDIKAYIKSQPEEDLPGLLTYIYDKQGAILAEGMFKDRDAYFNLQWREQFDKLYNVAELVKARIIGKSEPSEIPFILDTQIFKGLLSRAEQAGLVSNNHWDSPTKLGKFVVLVNKTDRAMNVIEEYKENGPLRGIAQFEKFFSMKNLSQYISTGGYKDWTIDALTEDLFGGQ